MRAKRETAAVIAFIASLYAFLEFVCKITCPIQYLTGVSCAGCGMSRAWMALARLDIASAWRYHPLFWLPPVWAVLWVRRASVPPKCRKALKVLSVMAFLGVYLYRMRCGNQDIVTFRPQDGLIARILFR